jgi:hypothetical protein
MIAALWKKHGWALVLQRTKREGSRYPLVRKIGAVGERRPTNPKGIVLVLNHHQKPAHAREAISHAETAGKDANAHHAHRILPLLGLPAIQKYLQMH